MAKAMRVPRGTARAKRRRNMKKFREARIARLKREQVTVSVVLANDPRNRT